MKLIRYQQTALLDSIGVATIGNFDGVHLGHQYLLRQVIQRARKLNQSASVIVFEPQPLEYFKPEAVPARLTKLREKIELFKDIGIDKIILVHFNVAFAKLSAEEFVKDFLARDCRVKELIVGDDFHFGTGRKGNYELLKNMSVQYGFAVQQADSFLMDGHRVSSSLIRDLLHKSDLKLVEKLLGRAYSLSGRVVHGNKLGRQLGFPTANILLKRRKSPVLGIYVVRMLGLGKPIFGVANIGSRPTVDQSTRVILEVYLFNFNQDIYGCHVTVELLHKLRDEERYDTLEALKAQIALDVNNALDWLSSMLR